MLNVMKGNNFYIFTYNSYKDENRIEIEWIGIEFLHTLTSHHLSELRNVKASILVNSKIILFKFI